VAFSLARDSAGNSIAANMAMIAITTSSSINVNPAGKRREQKTARWLMGRRLIFIALQASKAIAGNKANACRGR
jgi:hypothetical protein